MITGTERCPLVISIGEGIGAVFTVVLLAVLIPRYDIRGAAAASTIAYGVVMVFLFWGRHRARVSRPDREVSRLRT
jgi:O-antigen/teichoic acid export membrane protein